jgi:malate/lactate dehydrogenase
MTYFTLKTLGAKKNKVMGMGGMLDLSRFKSFIRDATNISRSSIQAMVISEHGENMLPLTRFSSIGGIPLHEFISKDKAMEIFEKKGRSRGHCTKGSDRIRTWQRNCEYAGVLHPRQKAGNSSVNIA